MGLPPLSDSRPTSQGGRSSSAAGARGVQRAVNSPTAAALQTRGAGRQGREPRSPSPSLLAGAALRMRTSPPVASDRGQPMACMRGPRKPATSADLPMLPSARFFTIWHLVARSARCSSLPDLAALCLVCSCSGKACISDMVWEELYKNKWKQDVVPNVTDVGGWRNEYLTRVRRSQANFKAKTLPSLLQRSRRKDGLPDLQKLFEALQVRFSFTVGPQLGCRSGGDPKKKDQWFTLGSDSVGIFSTSVLLRCSFSRATFKPPLQVEFRGRSAALGTEHTVLVASMPAKGAELVAADENFVFFRSTCGRVLFCIWKNDGTLAGLFLSLHHMHLLEPFLLQSSKASLEHLAGKPAPDDLDSQLGLHDYSILLNLHSSKLEVFSNCFYKVAANKECTIGKARARRMCTLESRVGSESGLRRTDSSAADFYEVAVANFEVLAPHDSGARPPFPCVRQPQLVFQSLAFKSILQDVFVLDATVFDEHGHVCWATSVVTSCQSGGSSPYESLLAARRFVNVDFDREDSGKGEAVRWCCVVERGSAHLVVQMEYSIVSARNGDAQPLPRLNTISWHPELTFLDAWWGSKYSERIA